ncbi:hypothetical protein P8C59_007245 [Phyllachora maydis]|uniref:Rab-GAP TBC domain-containing protein n=1 Tax=Phyllachora maydis TaxID=1825666 RepID=A0AAD9I805_9PEZI|nr:hypothetical protein P8C59_007245 [Phyllachora maydis]
MTSWYSQLLTTTSSRINNLQRTLLASEADGDTEDDTHVCRVLRAYYTEKGRSFPTWLPPDPKAPPPVQPVFTQQSQVGSRYGGLGPAASGGNNTNGGGLSSLWDRNQQQPQDPASLRQGRGAPPPMRGADAANSRNPFLNNRGGDPRDDVQARPLPSQRAGSYQQYGRNNNDSAAVPPGSSSGPGGSAQDRLRQRLWGARTASPSGAGPYQPPPAQQAPPSGSGRYGGGGGAAGAADYEERFAPGGRSTSPTGSFYAMSDDEEGDYDTITSTETGRGVKLLFSKSKVYVHPTPSAKDNISGYIALLQQKPTTHDRPTSSSSLSKDSRSPASSDLLLAWIPESSLGNEASIYVKVDLSDGESPPRQSYLVAPPPTVTRHRDSVGPYSFAIPVSAIYSLLVRPPSLGWWFGSVIINSRAGDSFPALFFHDSECQSTILQQKRRARDTFDPFGQGGHMFWGGDEVLRWLRRYVLIERSAAEPNIYLVEPTAEDSAAFGGKVTMSSTSSALGRTDSGAGPSARGAAGAAPGGNPHGSGAARDGGMDPLMKFVKETGWNIMEKFSKVTTFTRQAAQDALDNPRMPPQVRRLLKNPEVQTLQEEFDSARIYLARWAMGIAEQGERDRSKRIWTARDVMELEDTDVGEFELLEGTTGLSLEEMRKPVKLTEWKKFFDARTGRLTFTVDEVKERMFHGGLDPEDGVRKEAWLFLLGVHDWYSTAEERKAHEAFLRDAYIKLKGAWWERQIDEGGKDEEGEWWREQKGRIEKDVHRTDRNIPIFAGEDIPHPDPESPFASVGTNVHMEQMKDMLLTYNEYNKDLGYVQGMSDLLAPIYAVLQDDAMAFWTFQHFMERMERNFLRDQSGMRTQLLTLDHLVQFMDPKLYTHLQAADSTNFFFFFRMLLVWYKREFAWLDVLHLWEVQWTDYLTSSFHLFVALAILEKHRDVIMTHLMHFDEVLKYVNELSSQSRKRYLDALVPPFSEEFEHIAETQNSRVLERKAHKKSHPLEVHHRRSEDHGSGAAGGHTGLSSRMSASPISPTSPGHRGGLSDRMHLLMLQASRRGPGPKTDSDCTQAGAVNLRPQESEDGDEGSRARAATTIQRIFRGYRVRRGMRGLTIDATTRWAHAIREARWREMTRPRARGELEGETDDLAATTQELSGNMHSSTARQKWKKVAEIARRAAVDIDADEDELEEDLDHVSSASSSDASDPETGALPAEKVAEAQQRREAAARKRREEIKARRRKDARVMGLPYFLEMVDLKHRYGSNLRTYHEEWKKADTKENFFYWLDYGEGRLLDIDSCPRERLDREQYKDSIHEFPYTTPGLADAKGVQKVRHVSAATIFNKLLRKTVRKNTWIFVADTNFRLYVGIKASGAFQHSSFLQGGRISAAGLIKIKDGRLRSLSPLSGHYRPPARNFRAFVHSLRDAGVDMSRVSISKSYAVLVGLEAYVKTRSKGKELAAKLGRHKDKLPDPEEVRRREGAVVTVKPAQDIAKDQGRKLRSQEATRFKSELSAYFPEYDEVIGNDPKARNVLHPETSILLTDSRPKLADRPSTVDTQPSSAENDREPRLPRTYPVRRYSDALFTDLFDAQTIDFSFLEARYTGKSLDDTLPDSVFEPAHKKAERLERSIRNSEKGRAQHEKDQIIRLLGGLEGHDWLRVMGVSGVTESRKKTFEPARDHFIKGCQSILEKFRAWAAEEKRRKRDKDKALAYARKESEHRTDGEVDAAEQFVEVSDAQEDQDVDGEDGEARSEGDPPDSDIDASIAKQLQEEAFAAANKRAFTSFFDKKYQRDAALSKNRRRAFFRAPRAVTIVPHTNSRFPCGARPFLR